MWSFFWRGRKVVWDDGLLTGNTELVAVISRFLDGSEQRLWAFGPLVKMSYTSAGVYAATRFLAAADGGVPSYVKFPWEGDYPDAEVYGKEKGWGCLA